MALNYLLLENLGYKEAFKGWMTELSQLGMVHNTCKFLFDYKQALGRKRDTV